MIKNNYVVRAKKFLEEFLPYLSDRKSGWAVSVAVNNFNREKGRKVKFRSGAVRYCLITSDYVIKWDYSPSNRRNFGGCKSEYDIYKQAVKDGYEYLFAKSTKINVNHHIFYVMPRIKNIGYKRHKGDISCYLTCEEFNYINDKLRLWDLHDGNFGLVNDQVVIIDYACHN